MLISCMFTFQLICAFVFAFPKSRFSHDLTVHKCLLATRNCDLYLDKTFVSVKKMKLKDPIWNFLEIIKDKICNTIVARGL